MRNISMRALPWLACGILLFPAAARGQSLDLAYNPIDTHFEPLAAAPDSGRYAPEVQAAILEGYRQLALVTDPADDLHLNAAETAFERAIDLDPGAAHAWNGSGIYELKKDEQWLVILESIKKILNRDHISMAIKAFERALEIDPGFDAGRYNLALAYRQARGEGNYRRAIDELKRLVREAPHITEAPLLLAVTYRDAGDLERLAALADSLPAGSDVPSAGRQLLLAYALFNTDRPEEGVAAYHAGLAAVEDEQQAALFWHDIRPIVSSETDAAFRAAPVGTKADFIRDFWQRLADRSFVTPDQRLVEHYRRLHHAYENFRLSLPERRHYSTIAAYIPPWQTGFDDRGVIWLRHGPPDDTAQFSGPAVEENLSWKYERTDGDPLVFHFVMREDVGDYKLVRQLSDALIEGSTKMTGQTLFNPQCGAGGSCDRNDARIASGDLDAMRELYASRGKLDPYYNLASTSLDRLTLEREESRVALDIQAGTTDSSFDPGGDGNTLSYPVQPVPFRGPGGEPEIAFYYALPTSAVSIIPYAQGGEIDYRYQIVVTGDGGGPVARAEEDVRIASASPIPQDAGVMLPAVRIIGLSPGTYSYGMKVTDLNSGRSGLVRGRLAVDGLSGDGLALSGIVLAGRVEPAGERSDHPLVRWGRLKVLPLPSLIFRREQPVYAYYEIYGLAKSAGEARYRTTYTLRAAEPDRSVIARFFSAVGDLLTEGEEEGAITYVFERAESGAAEPLLEYFSLDVSDSPPGDYVLEVAIEDLTAGTTARRQVPLRLIE